MEKDRESFETNEINGDGVTLAREIQKQMEQELKKQEKLIDELDKITTENENKSLFGKLKRLFRNNNK